MPKCEQLKYLLVKYCSYLCIGPGFKQGIEDKATAATKLLGLVDNANYKIVQKVIILGIENDFMMSLDQILFM